MSRILFLTLFFLFFSAWSREVFYVPGWRTGFTPREAAVQVLHRIYPGMEVRVKSWNSAVSYFQAEQNAEIYAKTLKQELLSMPESRRKELILVGHSLGTRIVLEALDALAEKGLKIHEAALLGAAVNWDDPRIANALNAVETRCWHIYSSRDILLKLYPLRQGTKALGQIGWSQRSDRFIEREMTVTQQHFAHLYLMELEKVIAAFPPWEPEPEIAPCTLRKKEPLLDQKLYWEVKERRGKWLLLSHKTGPEFRIADPQGMICSEGKEKEIRKEFQKLRKSTTPPPPAGTQKN